MKQDLINLCKKVAETSAKQTLDMISKEESAEILEECINSFLLEHNSSNKFISFLKNL